MKYTSVVLALALPMANAMAQAPVEWSTSTHTPHFADVNGDKISDLLLQAKHPAHNTLLVTSNVINQSVQYLAANQTVLPDQPANAKLALADVNGDGFSDLFAVYPDESLALTYLGSAQGLQSGVASHQYQPSTLEWLQDAADFDLSAGDFNGDGRQDILAVSAQKHSHYLMHSGEDGTLSVSQTLKGNVKWGKNKADKLLVKDFNGDGRDDVFAWAKKQNQSHYVIYANKKGLLKASKKIQAQVTGQDWHADQYSVGAGNINSDKATELVRFNNAQGGIDENGVEVLAARAATTLSPSYAPATDLSSRTQLLFGTPPTPPNGPGNGGNSYKPVNISYSVPFNIVFGATYYQLYESTTDSNYQLVYSGSATSSNFIHSSPGYQYYKYKACNSSGCSGMSPWRRLYIYVAPSTPNNLSISPLNVSTGDSYTVSWGVAGGAVDGAVYTAYESFNGGTETVAHTVSRVHWSETGYSFNTSKSVGGTYSYRVQACNPSSVGCGGYATASQTVTAPNTAPVASADNATVAKNATVDINVTANDSDADGHPLTASLYSNPSHGSVSVVNNQMRYTPTSNYSGSDSFQYRVQDSMGSYSNVALVSINVNNTMGAPALSRVSSPNMLEYTVQWTPSAGATRYELNQQKNGGSWTQVYNGVSTSMIFSQPVIANYDYQVRACDSSSCTAWSAVLPAMRLKNTYTATDVLGTPILRSNSNQSIEKTKYSYPYGQQEDK